jgi:hypothetical protein
MAQRSQPATEANMEMANGGWERPERSQGNDCQANNPNDAFFLSPAKHYHDIPIFFQDKSQ